MLINDEPVANHGYYILSVIRENKTLAKKAEFTVCQFNRGGFRISGKGVHMYKGVGVRFADFISFFLNIP